MPFTQLVRLLEALPAIMDGIDCGISDHGWWLQFDLHHSHQLSWHVVQELAHALNPIEPENKKPTRFFPVSPAPYEAGGPDDCMAWKIECTNNLTPNQCAQLLTNSLPQPIDDPDAWVAE